MLFCEWLSEADMLKGEPGHILEYEMLELKVFARALFMFRALYRLWLDEPKLTLA